ncbi:hypothetical protein CK203_066680 [Vitis vinifera]|uniref:SAM-dependent MTase RsmB/NOP-type domain-containing protein n=1 Tax=Vitis vinifera TaxID=29760 RepID=A0A438EVN5_VITVI|nr:hypothetical protein CK203_066680 [Vitis vinifera]
MFVFWLQFRLLSNGFRLLKVGGSLVYSTCSLTAAQNEDVVEQFLRENASAGIGNANEYFVFIPISFLIGMNLVIPMMHLRIRKITISPRGLAELQEIDAATSWPCKSGGIPKTLRFDPLTSQTSGLFVAKFTKLAS